MGFPIRLCFSVRLCSTLLVGRGVMLAGVGRFSALLNHSLVFPSYSDDVESVFSTYILVNIDSGDGKGRSALGIGNWSSSMV